MGRISRYEILQACIDGVKKSFEEYKEWTSCEWLWNAPEYLMTINIAKEICSIPKDSKFITLEDGVKSILSNANAKIKGRLSKDIRPDGRSDIVVWWGKGTPRGIIEVKKSVYQKRHLQDDINRICGMLKKKSDMQFGVFVFYIDKHYETGNAVWKIENRIMTEFVDKIKKDAKNYKFIYKYECIDFSENDKDAAYVFAGMITR